MTHDLLPLLWRATALTTLALILVLALRRPWRRYADPSSAYALWLLVPLLPATLVLPAPTAEHAMAAAVLRVVTLGGTPTHAAAPVAAFDAAPWLVAAWLAGTVASALWFASLQRRYVRRYAVLRPGMRAGRVDAAAPAVVGLWRTRVLLPRDFAQRYTRAERRLILAHERVHLRRGDLFANAAAATLRCLFWFHPLVHFGAARFRDDQELACDAVVMRRFPEARRCYAGAMLKVQLAGTPWQEPRLPVGCHWLTRHPLNERIAMLKHSTLYKSRRSAGLLAAAAALLAASVVAWSAQPATPAVAQTGYVDAHLTLSVDGGAASHPRLVSPLGQAFAVATEESGHRWEATLTATRTNDDKLRLAARVVRDGVELGAPTLLLTPGQDAGLDVSTPDAAHRLHLKFVLALSDTLPADLGDSAAQRDSGIQYAKLVPIDYPEALMRAHVQGRVVVHVHVQPDGAVDTAQVIGSTPAAAMAFADTTLAGVRTWTFEPARRDGRAVDGWVDVPVDFILNDDDDGLPADAPLGALDVIQIRPHT